MYSGTWPCNDWIKPLGKPYFGGDEAPVAINDIPSSIGVFGINVCLPIEFGVPLYLIRRVIAQGLMPVFHHIK
jgi:hypothetical protein